MGKSTLDGGIKEQLSANSKSNGSMDNSSKFDPTTSPEQVAYLKSIDESLKSLLQNSNNVSQSNAKNDMPRRSDFRNPFTEGKNKSHRKGDAKDQFIDGMNEALLESVLGEGFKDKIGETMMSFADSIGVELEEIPATVGKELMNQAISAFKSTPLGDQVYGKIDDIKNQAGSWMKDKFNSGVDAYNAKHPPKEASNMATDGMGDAVEAVSDIVSGQVGDLGEAAAKASGAFTNNAASIAASGTAIANGSMSVGAALSGVGSIVASAATTILPILPIIAGVVIAFKMLKKGAELLAPAFEGAKEFAEGMKAAGNRYNDSMEKNLELAKSRLESDVKAMIEAPFDILEDAAQSFYDTWDNNLKTINATQGYNKSDLQNLVGNYAERLRSEGLSDVIASTEITDNLAKVLESGLSGRAATEFAYIATKLNAAIPTQDFFDYADTYASLAANAIKNGKSESEAIAYATSKIEEFANSVLYANRQLAGGFSTGLQSAGDLFTKSVQIAQASKTGDPTDIAGVLTSVAAITGAIAPDLATVMTDAIVDAATGGNSSELVALRSLAGVNASNTEFLRAFANNPKKIFTDLFNNLAEMYSYNNDAFMEKAEAYASLFGLSMDAFTRIDFAYLAKSISQMNSTQSALNENIALLVDGQTTTTAEQLKAAQINEYAIEHGLALVLDNEVARSIQEHMWEEQLAREIMESQYAVDLQGSALEFLQGIRKTIDNIFGLLNPMYMLNKLTNLVATSTESVAQQADIRKLLMLGQVGNGNAEQLRQLTTTNANLNVAPSLLAMMGSYSNYELVSGMNQLTNAMVHRGTNNYIEDAFKGGLNAYVSTAITSSLADIGINSKYRWGSVGKSTAAFLTSGEYTDTEIISKIVDSVSSSTAAQSVLTDKVAQMLSPEYIQKFLDDGTGYEGWARTASQFNISNIASALNQAGYSETQVQGYFQEKSAIDAAEVESERRKQEDEFWKESINDIAASTIHRTKEEEFWQSNIDNQLEMIELITINNNLLDSILKKHSEFFESWVSYFVEHTAYSKAYNHADVSRIQNTEKAEAGQAIYALAEALVQNTVDLRDPQVQTNALLSQILIVAQAIMQQNNGAGNGLSLPDSLSALALGIVNTGN